MKLEVITPESHVFTGEVNAVSLPGSDGVFQVLNNHAPIISSLKEGVVRIEGADKSEISNPAITKNDAFLEIKIRGGVAELMNNKLIVLAD